MAQPLAWDGGSENWQSDVERKIPISARKNSIQMFTTTCPHSNHTINNSSKSILVPFTKLLDAIRNETQRICLLTIRKAPTLQLLGPSNWEVY